MMPRISLVERIVRAAVAVLLGAFAIALAPASPWAAIAAGILAVGVAVMAVTGRCASMTACAVPAEPEPSTRHSADAPDEGTTP